jgi:hypothetical protein
VHDPDFSPVRVPRPLRLGKPETTVFPSIHTPYDYYKRIYLDD